MIIINSTTSQTSFTYYLTNSILETGPLHTRYIPYKQPPQNAVFTVNLITRPKVEGGSTLTTSFTCSLVTLPQCSMMPGMWPIPTTPTTVGGVNPSSLPPSGDYGRGTNLSRQQKPGTGQETLQPFLPTCS